MKGILCYSVGLNWTRKSLLLVVCCWLSLTAIEAQAQGYKNLSPTTRYLLAGSAGTIVGFGWGHYLIDEIRPWGAVFFIGELATAGLALSAGTITVFMGLGYGIGNIFCGVLQSSAYPRSHH